MSKTLEDSSSCDESPQGFRTDTPMNEMLQRMLGRARVGRIYNPAAAAYVCRRKAVVDWMCEIGEEMRYRTEAIHHSVALFDAYYSTPNIEEIQRKSAIATIIDGKSTDQVT